MRLQWRMRVICLGTCYWKIDRKTRSTVMENVKRVIFVFNNFLRRFQSFSQDCKVTLKTGFLTHVGTWCELHFFCLHGNWWFWMPCLITVWSEYPYLAWDIISLSKSNISVGWTVTLKIKFENFSKDQVVQAQFKSYKKA
jgi:hypothetical protein